MELTFQVQLVINGDTVYMYANLYFMQVSQQANLY